MKKISQINWNRYKDSEEGRKAIALFERICSSECTTDEMYEVAKKYDPEFFRNMGERDEKVWKDRLAYFYQLLTDIFEGMDIPDEEESCIALFLALTRHITAEGDEDIEDIPQSKFKDIIGGNILFSMVFYSYMPNYFIPNLFVMQFIYLRRLASKYDLELPDVPNRADYRGRWFYYIEMCNLLNDFAIANDLGSAELCAFLFAYEIPLLKEEMENEKDDEMPEVPSQAWILVGNYGEGEKIMQYGFWQANQLTEKGDLLLFYEKSPIKALTSVWIAQQDGVVDPFFYYYSNTYIGDKIAIPNEQAVTFADFKNSEYFQNRDRKGNYVSKNFQDVSGWAVTYEDYKEIKHILECKGFDTSVLPSLYEPTKVGDVKIQDEADVSELMLVPLLEQMGWQRGVDFKGEVEFNAGRTKTNHSSDKRPDFCLHIKERKDDIEAKVVLEVKKLMKNHKEIHEAFKQGRSYAKWGAVEVLVLVDMRQILVYERDNDYRFNEDNPRKYSWADMETPDKYAELKRILS